MFPNYNYNNHHYQPQQYQSYDFSQNFVGFNFSPAYSLPQQYQQQQQQQQQYYQQYQQQQQHQQYQQQQQQRQQRNLYDGPFWHNDPNVIDIGTYAAPSLNDPDGKWATKEDIDASYQRGSTVVRQENNSTIDDYYKKFTRPITEYVPLEIKGQPTYVYQDLGTTQKPADNSNANPSALSQGATAPVPNPPHVQKSGKTQEKKDKKEQPPTPTLPLNTNNSTKTQEVNKQTPSTTVTTNNSQSESPKQTAASVTQGQTHHHHHHQQQQQVTSPQNQSASVVQQGQQKSVQQQQHQQVTSPQNQSASVVQQGQQKSVQQQQQQQVTSPQNQSASVVQQGQQKSVQQQQQQRQEVFVHKIHSTVAQHQVPFQQGQQKLGQQQQPQVIAVQPIQPKPVQQQQQIPVRQSQQPPPVQQHQQKVLIPTAQQNQQTQRIPTELVARAAQAVHNKEPPKQQQQQQNTSVNNEKIQGNATSPRLPMKDDRNPVVFFDIEIDDEPRGRLVMELYRHALPQTAQNFLFLATHQQGFGFRSSYFHRIIPGFMAQGGDFEKSDGTGGYSVFGEKFDDEGFVFPHDRPGLLSMANVGPDTNGSQFFITFAPCPHLNNKHVVFGQVLQGFHLLKDFELCGTASGEVMRAVKIVNSDLLQ